MNTKTTKFLAVLAVFAMAFAAVAVIAETPAEVDAAAGSTGVYKDKEAKQEVAVDDLDGKDGTWYVTAEASITDVTTISKALVIKLADGVTSSKFTINGVTSIDAAVTIDAGVEVIIPEGKKLTVTSTLTINGTLENNAYKTTSDGEGTEANGLIINGGKITGNGTICGTSPRLVKILDGTLEKVTVSQKDWEAGDGTKDLKGNEEAVIFVSPSASATVKIENITVLLKDTGKRDATTTYGTHGIGVYGAATCTVTINKVTFSAIGSGTVEEEFIILDKNDNATVTITEITRDSDVRIKDGYGEFTVEKVKHIGSKIIVKNSNLSYLRLADDCEIDDNFAIDNIIFKDSSAKTLTVKTGKSLTVNGGIINKTDKKFTIAIENGGKVINNGTTRVEGIIAINASATGTGDAGFFNNTGTLVMDKKAEILNLTNTKTVRIYDAVIGKEVTAGSEVGNLVNDGTIYVMSEDAVIQVKTQSGSGTIDTSAVAKEVFIHGDISTAGTVFTKNQIVTFDGDTTLLEGASMTFKGTAIIPAGVTVTISHKAAIEFVGSADNLGKLVNNGRLIIEGFIPGATGANATPAVAGLTVTSAQVENNGTIELAYDGDTASAELINITENSQFKNNGNITIGEKSKLTTATASLVNSATGVITVFGDLNGADSKAKGILNAGSITLSSNVNHAIYILNNAAGAEVNVMMTKAKVTVDDSKFTKESDKFKNGENKIELGPGTNNIPCGGVTITSVTFPVSVIEDNKPVIYTHTALVVEGALIVSKEGEIVANDQAILTLTSNANGRIAVVDELTLTDTTFSTANNTTNLYVSGSLSITKGCTFANVGELTVDGVLYMVEKSITGDGVINAAKYEIAKTVLTDKVTVYTNVPDAIEGATEASVDTVTITGTVKIEESVLIPAGMKVKVSKSGADAEDKQVVTIAKDVVVEVYSDDTGFAILENNSNIKVNGKLIFDDVKKSQKGNKDKIVSEVILESGKTVTYTTLAWAIADTGSEEATLKLCGNTTITTNMTIPENITVDTNGKNFTVSNAELTIDGELFLKSGTTYTVTGDKAKIIVNGAITSESQMTYDKKAYPAGLYLTVGDKKTYVIGNIDDAEAWALLADDDKLTYWGDLETIGISFDAEATLTFEGNVTAVSMSVGSKAVVNFNGNVEIATVTMGAAKINFAAGKNIDGLFTSPVGSILFSEAKADKASNIAVTVKDTVTTMTLDGSITVSEDIKSEYQVATVGDVIVKADLVELTVGTGTTTVAKDVTISLLEVYGDLVIDNTYKMTTTAAMVYGSITANAATDTKAKATAEISYLSAGIDYKRDVSTSAAASIEGDVTVKFAIVSADATVSASIESLPYATDVYIEGELFMTIYGSKSEEITNIEKYVDFDLSDPSADFKYWVDEDGEKVTDPKIGAPTEIYAVYDYNVYNVKIITDAGIKSVAINGVELENGSGNVFYVPSKLTAGTYKVTYTLKNGYSGDAVLSTSTGTILKDNSFVISPGSDDSTVITFQLAGTEPTPEPEPVTPEEKSEWTVTTILLVILVILIAIMAVIVALRLNRN